MPRWLTNLVLVFLLLGVGFLWLLHYSRLPSDQSIVAKFHQDKPHFERLQKMLASDISIRSVAEYGVTTDSSGVAKPYNEVGMPEARYNEYMSNIRSAKAFSANHDDEEYRFGVDGRGFASKGWRISYVFRDSPPDSALIIDTIDGFKPTGSKWRIGYRPLEENWYVKIIW